MTPDQDVLPPRDGARRGRLVAALLVAALCVAQSALAFDWLARNGFLERPFVSDAGWYRVDALRLRRGFENGGLLGWLAAGLREDGSHPPVVPMAVGLASALSGSEGVPFEAAFAVIQCFAAAFVVGTYVLARRFMGPAWSFGAAAVAASFPVVLQNLRPYFPQLPMAAALAWTFASLLASEGFTRRRASIAFGAVAGFATMVKMLAPLYFGGAAAAALVFGLRRGSPRRDVAINLLLALAAFALVAGPWYALHWRSVSAYTAYVTGDEGQERYSASVDEGTAARWIYYPFHLLNAGTGWFVAIVFVPALVAAIVAAARSRRAAPDAAASRRLNDALVLAAAPALAYVPLTLGQIAARAFYLLPFLPFAALLVARFGATRRRRAARAVVAAWCFVASLLHQALALRPPESDGPPRAWLTGSETLAALTPLEDRRAPFPGLPNLPVSDDPAVNRRFPFDVLPRIDDHFGAAFRAVHASPGRPGERWPVAEYVAEAFRDATIIRPRLALLLPRRRPHPYLGHMQFAYEAELARRDLAVVLLEDLARRGEDPLRRLAVAADYVVVDERTTRDAVGLQAVLAGLSRGAATGEVLRRDRPTPEAGAALVAVRRNGSARGPRPAADAVAEDVVRVAAEFADGWRLEAARVVASEESGPFVVGWFDGLRPGAANLRAVATLVVDGRRTASVAVRLEGAAACDATHPLFAVTWRDLPEPPENSDAVLVVGVTSARPDALEGLSRVVGASVPSLDGRGVVLPIPRRARTVPASPPSPTSTSLPVSRPSPR